MIRSSISLAAAALVVGGCVGMSRSETVSPLSDNWTRTGRIETIALTKGDIKVTSEFDEIFKSRVKSKLDACAKGPTPLALEVTLDRLDKANPVLTTVVAGANVLRGQARLVNPATGAVVADYKIGKTIVGGRFAIVVMGQAEEQLSDAFGDELCKQAFLPPEK
ncbi:MAG: hypothetical protein Q8M88_17550 [Phenylobacterium sp.]|uniref:hypothetical protein n=1 Tax=Phenylobacterium sp. TaxID=1871053 RepID=UPI00273418A0|nr:hypothetical protein [Phenylobacterium sp.]MDP3176232.1 hypothetical protein [Phenylobacterium sp.]